MLTSRVGNVSCDLGYGRLSERKLAGLLHGVPVAYSDVSPQHVTSGVRGGGGHKGHMPIPLRVECRRLLDTQ